MQKECNQHLYMAVGEMPVADTDCEGFLLEYWQVTEQILVRLVIGILIQLHVVKAGKGKPVTSLRGSILVLNLTWASI